MKVLFVTSDYVSPMRGGVEHVTYVLARGLRAEGVDVYIACAHSPLTEAERDPAIGVLPEDNAQREDFLGEMVATEGIGIILNQAHERAVFDLCQVVAAKCGCKLVSTYHTDPCAVLKGLRDIDVVRRHLSGRLKGWAYSAYWLLRFPYRYYSRRKYIAQSLRNLYEHSNAVVLLSERFKPSFMAMTGIKDSSHLFAISNPAEAVSSHAPVDKEKILLFVGRMEFAAKRPDRIVRMWERMNGRFRDWRLVMVGDGPARPSLMAYCNKRGIDRIEFTGWTNPRPYYEKAAILCVTSSYEGFSLVIQEAQSDGAVPVVYNSYEAVADLVEDGVTGLLVKPFDQDAYMQSLARLMEHDEERQRMSVAARNASSLAVCSVEKITQKWIELFKKLS